MKKNKYKAGYMSAELFIVPMVIVLGTILGAIVIATKKHFFILSNNETVILIFVVFLIALIIIAKTLVKTGKLD